MLILIARLLALLVVGVMVVPWLSRYLPWRAERLATVRAAHPAIRGRPIDVTTGAMQRALATRALNRLSYPELLEYTADPFGDFAAGRLRAVGPGRARQRRAALMRHGLVLLVR